jgi:hypothetical protein
MSAKNSNNLVLANLDLTSFETRRFPQKLCRRKTGEAGVKEAEATFVCVLVDHRFDSSLRVALLRPYTWTGKDGAKRKTLFGWADAHGNTSDHCTRAVHGDPEVVVAWKTPP